MVDWMGTRILALIMECINDGMNGMDGENTWNRENNWSGRRGQLVIGV